MNDNLIYCVYCFTNKYNNKKYIGKTGDIIKRIKIHTLANGDCPAFHNAIKKYGIDNFEFNIIEYCISEKDSLDKEIYYINMYNTNTKKYGYNLTKGGDGISGHIHSKESRLKMSMALKGRTSPNKGKIFSKETKLKLSESHLGQDGYWTNKKLSEEHKNKISKSHKGKVSNMLGKIHSDKSKEKMSAARIGKYIGINNKKSILTILIVKQIRDLYSTNNYTYDQLAKQFDVGRTTVWRIITNINYFNGETNE